MLFPSILWTQWLAHTKYSVNIYRGSKSSPQPNEVSMMSIPCDGEETEAQRGKGTCLRLHS